MKIWTIGLLALLTLAGCAPDIEIQTGTINGLYSVNLREAEDSCDETPLDRNCNLWVIVQEYREDGGFVADFELGDKEIVWEDIQVSASGDFDAEITVGRILVDRFYGNISNGHVTARLETAVFSLWDESFVCSSIYEISGEERAEAREPPEWWLENQ